VACIRSKSAVHDRSNSAFSRAECCSELFCASDSHLHVDFSAEIILHYIRPTYNEPRLSCNTDPRVFTEPDNDRCPCITETTNDTFGRCRRSDVARDGSTGIHKRYTRRRAMRSGSNGITYSHQVSVHTVMLYFQSFSLLRSRCKMMITMTNSINCAKTPHAISGDCVKHREVLWTLQVFG